MANVIREELWALAEAEAAKRGEEPEWVFGRIGLFLEIPPVNAGYYPTPTNTSTFAATHGDSVHYGLLHINGAVTDISPVIMTVPCNYRNQTNFVLGEDLWEFLCLGCEVGYFGLENLAYDRADTLDYLSRADHPERLEGTADDRERLAVLTEAFALTPWTAVEVRLERLHQTYHGLLVLPADD